MHNEADMRTMRSEPSGGSIGQLLRGLIDDLRDLVTGEIQLARSEASDKIGQITNAAISIAAGALLGLAALIILLDALVLALAQYMPAWLAAVIVGGVVAVIGLVLVLAGQRALKASHLAPNRTMGNIQKDMDVVKRDARS